MHANRALTTQRSATAIEAFVRDLLKDPVHYAENEVSIATMVQGEVYGAPWQLGLITAVLSIPRLCLYLSPHPCLSAQRNHQAVTGRFANPEQPSVAVFANVANALRDECAFIADTSCVPLYFFNVHIVI
jgi:hypothetical protein